jgi:hypothetical protein
MKSLLHADDRRMVLERLRRLSPESVRRWGKLTAPQMVCHLTDSFNAVLGERQSSRPTRLPPMWRRRVVKFFALSFPMHWPHTVKTRPEVDPQQDGTQPGVFAADLRELERTCERYVNGLASIAGKDHFMFGTMTEGDWGRWGYLHMDHHLRQFGL